MRRSLGAGWRPWVQAAFCPASAADEGKLRLALRASRHSRRWFPRRVLFGEGQCVLKQSERAGEGPDAGIGRARLLAALGNGPLVGRQPVPGPSFEKRPFASSAVALLSPEEVQRQPLRSSASLKARPEEEEKEKRRRQGVSAETALVQKALRILRIRATAYWRLSKGRLSVWVGLSSTAGFAAAIMALQNTQTIGAFAGEFFFPASLVALGVTGASASANALNQIIERRLDAQMRRTCSRPLASGQLQVAEALAYATFSGVAGLTLLHSAFPQTSAASLAAGTLALYAGIYTPSKTLTPWCTHIGAVVGALPLLVGWAAAGTPLFSGGDLLVAGLMYVWQLPHFYALVYMHQKDYAAAGYKMWGLPALGGVEKCLSLCMRYSYALAAAPFVAAACGVTTTLFPLSSVPASAFVLCQLKRFTESPSRRNALRFFLHSLWYIMGMLFLAAWTMKPFDFKRRKEEDAAAVHSSLRCECPLGALKIFGQRGEGAPLGSLSNFSEHTNSYASAEGFVVGESGGCPRSFFPAAATVAAVNGQGDFRKGGLLRPYLSSLCMHRGLLSHANVCPWLRRERKRIEKHNPQHW